VHKYEIIGAIVAIIGTILICLDPQAARMPSKTRGATKGGEEFPFPIDPTLLLSSIPAALYFALNKSLMHNRLIPHIFLMNAFTCIGFCMLAIFFSKDIYGKKNI
jgi:drug/metabolite transporter (DMT)-like permease